MIAIAEVPLPAEHFGYKADDPLMVLLMQAAGGELEGELDSRIRMEDHGRRLKALVAETPEELQQTLIGPDEVAFLDSIYWGGVGKTMLGVSVTDLVRAVPVPERMLHEAVHQEIGLTMANDLRELITERGGGEVGHHVLEIGSGIGSLTYALVRTGFKVEASVEKNSDILRYTQSVWGALSLPEVHFVKNDGWSLLDEEAALLRSQGLSVVVADPPWDGAYISSNGNITYDWGLFGAQGETLIQHMLQAAPVAAVKLPGAFRDDAVAELVKQMNQESGGPEYSYTIFSYELTIGDRVVREKLLVVAEGEGLDNEVVERPLSQNAVQ